MTEALEAYEQAIALQPDYAKAQTELAIVLTRLNRHAEALGRSRGRFWLTLEGEL